MKSSLTKSEDRLEKVKSFINYLLDNKTTHSLLNTACSELGISYTELIPDLTEDSHSHSIIRQVNEFRISHIEARRKAKINLLASFILENKLKPKTIPNLTPDPVRINPDKSLEDYTDRKVNSIKKAIYYQLTVEENLKKLQKKEENDKKLIEDRLKEKDSREIIKTVNKKIFELRDQRIKAKLDKKKKDLEAHELKGLNYKPVTKEKPSHYTSLTPHYKPTSRSESPDDTLEISATLEKINNKLNNSATRAQEILLTKKIPGQQYLTHLARVRTLRDHLLIKQESEKLQILQKLQKDQEFSNKRRNFLTEQKKFIRSLNNKAKKNKEKNEEVNCFEYKNEIIEKARKDVKESNEQKSQFINMKIALRKKDQEENMKRIVGQMRKDKDKLIEKIKDVDSSFKGKTVVDVEAIRAQVKKEFRKNRAVDDIKYD